MLINKNQKNAMSNNTHYINKSQSKTNRTNPNLSTSSKRMNSSKLDPTQTQTEKKNKQLINEKYEQKLHEIELAKETLEKELSEAVAQLNKQETKIYAIQKRNLDKFKSEILKYENIYYEIKSKIEQISTQLNQSEHVENILYNQTFMVFEDYLSYNNELIILRNKMKDKLEKLNALEKSFPKEFNFMQEDYQLETDLKALASELKVNKKNLRLLDKDTKTSSYSREQLLTQIVVLEAEVEDVLNQIKMISNDNNVNDIEQQITKNISDLIIWENLKEIMKDYFLGQQQQHHSSTTTLMSDKLANNLEMNLQRIKTELNEVKKEKIKEKNIIYEQIEKTKNDSNNAKTKRSLNKNKSHEIETQTYNTLIALQQELENIIAVITQIDHDTKALESLFMKYIVLIRNNETNVDEFEHRFKTEIIALMTRNAKLTDDDITSMLTLIEHYFKELTTKNAKIHSLQAKKLKTQERIAILNGEIDHLNEKIKCNQLEMQKLTEDNTNIESQRKNIKQTITARNDNLKSNLQSLGDAQFQLYLDTNREVLKNMKKIYGLKILNKVSKVQKEKFLENVIIDHSRKKDNFNEYISFITRYEDVVKCYKKEIENLNENYQALLQKYESCINYVANRNKEKKILEESNNDLKEKMEIILENQVHEIQMEKQKLQLKYSVFFYLERINEIQDKIEQLNESKRILMDDYRNIQQ